MTYINISLLNTTLSLLNTTFSNATGNATKNSTVERPCDIQLEEQILLCGYVILFLIGTSGNTLVIFVFRKSLTNGPIIDMLILLLAVCDLASSLISPTLTIYWIVGHKHWDFGNVACKIIPTLSRILMDISIGILLIMAIDRCRAIVTPFKIRFSRSFVLSLCLLTVVLSIVGQMYYTMSLEVTEEGKCLPKEVGRHSYFIPLISLLTMRILVFMFIFWLTTVAIRVALNRSSTVTMGNEVNMERRTKATKMIVLMAIVFTLTITPRDMLHLAYTISQTLLPERLKIPYS